jgi:hypothetical protein
MRKLGLFLAFKQGLFLPAVPFLILMAGPFLKAVERHWRWLAVACAPILIYNCVCSYYVGRRFNDDPRMPAQVWMEANVKAGSRIESSAGSPHWRTLPGLDAVEVQVGKPPGKEIPPGKVVDLRMPHPNGRAILFERYSRETGGWKGKRQPMKGTTTSNCSASKNCSRGIQTIDSSVYQVPNETAKSYYHNLMQEKFPYRVVYDRQSPPVSQWIYPRVIDDLQDRTILLVRK